MKSTTFFLLNVTLRKRMMFMYWYLIQDHNSISKSLINFFNKEKDTQAFEIKIEKWFVSKKYRKYIIQDLYPGYVFVKTILSEEIFLKTYSDYFESIKLLATLVKQGDTYALAKEVQSFYEKLIDSQNIIRHSIGNIVDSQLIIETGPLVGLEDKISKINRHKRIAEIKLDQNDMKISCPLEVVSKS